MTKDQLKEALQASLAESKANPVRPYETWECNAAHWMEHKQQKRAESRRRMERQKIRKQLKTLSAQEDI
jgi:hypothetical protein